MEQNKNTEVKSAEVENAAVKAQTAEEKAEVETIVNAAKDSSKKATIAIVLGVISLVFLAGTKFIFGSSFFYFVALLFGVAAFLFVYNAKDLTKKVVIATVIATTPMVVSGYNLLGIVARDAIIDLEVRHVEHEVERDFHEIFTMDPEFEADVKKDIKGTENTIRKDAKEFEQKVKEDAAKTDANN